MIDHTREIHLNWKSFLEVSSAFLWILPLSLVTYAIAMPDASDMRNYWIGLSIGVAIAYGLPAIVYLQHFFRSIGKSVIIDETFGRLVVRSLRHEIIRDLVDIQRFVLYCSPNRAHDRYLWSALDAFYYHVITFRDGSSVVLTCLMTKPFEIHGIERKTIQRINPFIHGIDKRYADEAGLHF